MGRVWFFLKKIFIYLFICGCAGSYSYEGFSLVVVSGSYSLAAMLRLLIALASLSPEHGL